MAAVLDPKMGVFQSARFVYVKIRPTRACCPRPRGNIQREAKNRGTRKHFARWGS